MISNAFKNNVCHQPKERVVLQGYFRKLKTLKKKYFVLYEESGTRGAHLEYFDNEKKFKSKSAPKRIIKLKHCFNINRRLDTKYEHVLELSTKDGSFDIIMETEEDINKWLKTLLKLQSGEGTMLENLKPTFEHVWQVRVQRKGLAEEKNILGSYHVCLTTKSLTLIRIGLEQTNTGEIRAPNIEFFLTTIRRCGDSQCLFYMEVGRHSIIGAGELWMETEDSFIAQSMHRMILNAMASKRNEESIGPMRKRSSSANEASKPISVLQRRQTHSGLKNINNSPLSGRDRCDSLPSSRHHATSECINQISTHTSTPRNIVVTNNRPQSMYGRNSHSPPLSAINPSSGCSESEGSSLSVDEADESENFPPFCYNSLSTGGIIPEEITDEFCLADYKKQNNFTSRISENFEDLKVKTNILISTNSYHNNCRKNSSLDLQSQYMDMISLYDSSQCKAISPSMEKQLKGNFAAKSSDQNKTLNLVEEHVSGYVSMAPIFSNENYQNQAPMIVNFSDDESGNLSSAQSVSSVACGDTSANLSFGDFSFKKPDCGLLDNETENEYDRPMRAYSVGSRLEHDKYRLRLDVFNNSEESDSRVRAFSVGSRTKAPQNDIQRNRLLSASNRLNNNNVNENNANNKSSNYPNNIPNGEKRFSSAPILIHKSQNNNERMSDLMEIDFSKNYCNRRDSFPSPLKVLSYPVNPHCNRPDESLNTCSKRIMDSNNSLCKYFDATSRIESSYLEMKPISSSINSKQSCPSFKEITLQKKCTSSAVTSEPLKLLGDYCKNDSTSTTPLSDFKRDVDFNHTSFENISGCVQCDSKSLNMPDKKQRKYANHFEFEPLNSLSTNQSFLETKNHNNTSTNTNQNIHIQEKCGQDMCIENLKLNYIQEKTSILPSFNIKAENEMSAVTDISNKQCSINAEPIESASSIPNIDILENTFANMFSSSPDYAIKELNSSLFKQKTSHNELNESNSHKDPKGTAIESYFFTGDESKIFKPISSTQKTYTENSCAKNKRSKFVVELRSFQCADSERGIFQGQNCCSSHPKHNFVRPSSVNSDKISPLKSVASRPNSVNSDCFQSISASSSSSTLCGSSSSSSILYGGKNQSSPPTSRPQSIGDKIFSSETCKDRLNMEEKSLILSRIPSMSSEHDLHYASLVLPPSTSSIHSCLESLNKELPSKSFTSCAEINGEDSTSKSFSPILEQSTLSPNLVLPVFQLQPSFTYAKIDFNLRDPKKSTAGLQK